LSLSSQNYGFGIRDPEKPIPDPGGKKAPDPGSGSATLHKRYIDNQHKSMAIKLVITNNTDLPNDFESLV
jgi:hypothetical protein